MIWRQLNGVQLGRARDSPQPSFWGGPGGGPGLFGGAFMFLISNV